MKEMNYTAADMMMKRYVLSGHRIIVWTKSPPIPDNGGLRKRKKKNMDSKSKRGEKMSVYFGPVGAGV